METQLPETLILRLRDRKCVLFAGAGLSAAAGLPTWDNLLRGISDWAQRKLPSAIDRTAIEAALLKGELTSVAQYLREEIGPEAFHKALTAGLQCDDVDLSPAHHLIPALPFRAVVTTNFDNLIERAYGGRLTVVTQNDAQQLAACIDSGQQFLLKAHGDLTRADTIVLSESDFARMVFGVEAFRQSFVTLLMTNAILFVGYSLSDPDFGLLIAHHVQLFDKQGPPRYALMPQLSPVARASLRAKSIQVLEYENHAKVPEFFKRLAEALQRPPVMEKAAPPSSFGNIIGELSLRRGESTSARSGVSANEVVALYQQAGEREMEFLLLSEHPEIKVALKNHLGAKRYAQERKRMSEGILKRQIATVPIKVILVPGFMGSSLAVQLSKRRSTLVWLNMWSLVRGGFSKLAMTDPERKSEIIATQVLKSGYQEFARCLARHREVILFPYDWRKDIRAAADELHVFVLKHIGKGLPFHIVAHSSGGLVARAFVRRYPDVWEHSKPSQSDEPQRTGRLVLLGSPNHGWFASLALLLGTEDLQRKLALIDLTAGLPEIRRVFASFPSLYQTLPSPRRNLAWEAFYDARSYGKLAVPQTLLDQGLAFHNEIAPAVDPQRMVCILGHQQATVNDVENPSNLSSPGYWTMTMQGDGRTAHALALLERDRVGVPTYYTETSHGDLTQNPIVLAAVNEILETGQTSTLKTEPPVLR